VQTIPGIPTNFKAEVDLDVVRIATGGTYDDPGKMIGTEAAVSLRIVEKEPCRQAAIYAFELARKMKKSMTSSSKHTIQRATDGLFETVVNEVAEGYPDVVHKVELFDALLAKIVLKPQSFQVCLVLNEYGDFLSDMACGLVGSLGIGASGNYGFDKQRNIRVGLFDAAHGTAPDIAGQGKANPTAIFLAFSLLLYHLGEVRAGSAIKNAALELLREGACTADVGGKMNTMEFTHAVADRAKHMIGDASWTSRTLRLHKEFLG
jgi:isocitrate dehydrogenase (NAD+)